MIFANHLSVDMLQDAEGTKEVQVTVKLTEAALENEPELILLINSDAYYGTLETLKDKVIDYVSDGGSESDCYIGQYVPISGVEFQIKKDIEVTMDDDRYREDEVNFLVLDSNGRRKGEFTYEDDALEWIRDEIIAGNGTPETYQLIRAVEYICTYDVEFNESVVLDIPEQEITVFVKETVPNLYPVDVLEKVDFTDCPPWILTKIMDKIYAEINRQRDMKKEEN